MFNIYLKNFIVHNYEYDLIETVKTVEDAKQYAYVHSFNMIVHFKCENIFWMSNFQKDNQFKLVETVEVCDMYLQLNDDDFTKYIKTATASSNKIVKNLLIVYGSMEKFTNYECLEKLSELYDIVGLIKKDSYIFLCEKVPFSKLFILNNIVNENDNVFLNNLKQYIHVLINNLSQTYKFLIYFNTKVICNDYLLIGKTVNTILNNEIDLIYTNNIRLFLICKLETFLEETFSGNSIVSFIRINENLLNHE